jgi:hypothetical protein
MLDEKKTFEMSEYSKSVAEKQIADILERGNTAEVKKTKDGIMILVVSRKIRYKSSNDSKPDAKDDSEELDN